MNTGGPAFPHGPLGDSIQFKDGRIAHQWPGSPGMDLIDWFAGQEDLADWDIEGAIIPANLATHFGGDMPQGGWSENPVAAFERDARIRAGMKYARAEAMLAEKARREGVVKGSSMTDHSPDVTKMIPDPFAEDALRRLASDVLPADIKDAASEERLTWCAEQVRAQVNTLEARNRELLERIKQLEEAGNDLVWWFCQKEESQLSSMQSSALKRWRDLRGRRNP